MNTKKHHLTIAMIIILMAIGGLLSWILRVDMVVIGLDSPLSFDEKRDLFEKYSHELLFPEKALEVCFRLEPGDYQNGDVYGEYIRFKATGAEEIEQFVAATLGEGARVESPSDYAQWHQGVGDYEWWRPLEVANPVYYEDGRKFITVDPDEFVVFYSYVRSYSIVKGNSSSRDE